LQMTEKIEWFSLMFNCPNTGGNIIESQNAIIKSNLYMRSRG
jgi:hypothetical protein